ncbi:MAG: hypothetical protein A2Z14_12490 [Chloroflexi bacterium RBG_16_48_8]|nr:MAG: hypothetical protein A2Z14_12490 [Chloroflexi bacterium RBG_16_48_8]
MKNHGFTSIHDFLGDLLVYRNLSPVDPRLGGFRDKLRKLGLSLGLVPRKSDPEYAHIMVSLLKEARSLEMPVSIERLVYIGDTRLNDGTAFTNICRAGGWRGLAFIGSDKQGRQDAEILNQGNEKIYLANCWSALMDFGHFCRTQGFSLDEATAILVDIDKTALGARGRNDHVIDQARIEAVRHTITVLLGGGFDQVRFKTAYDRFNQPEFHAFTADNQDYLAYICLILGCGLYGLGGLVNDVQTGRLASFEQMIAEVDGQCDRLPPELNEIHGEIYRLVRKGDPTPFKAFRFSEYKTTAERMGKLDEDAEVDQLLQEEIVITQEVREVALMWRDQGALLFGLSDKPDEASIPSPELASRGYLPIHRIRTHAVGV